MSDDNVDHFSHEHSLAPTKVGNNTSFNCNACQQKITTTPYYACNHCKYYLDEQCFNAPRSLHHPTHPSHHLTLQSTVTYTNNRFNCNLCGVSSSTFCYTCAHCCFDLHISCALPTPRLVLPTKHAHTLKPVVRGQLKQFGCDACDVKEDGNYWVYYCGECNYGLHLHCAMPEKWPKMPDDQHEAVAKAITPPQKVEEREDHGHSSLSDKTTETNVARACCKGNEVDHVGLAMDGVMEVQILLAKVQSQLSKAQMASHL